MTKKYLISSSCTYFSPSLPAELSTELIMWDQGSSIYVRMEKK